MRILVTRTAIRRTRGAGGPLSYARVLAGHVHVPLDCLVRIETTMRLADKLQVSFFLVVAWSMCRWKIFEILDQLRVSARSLSFATSDSETTKRFLMHLTAVIVQVFEAIVPDGVGEEDRESRDARTVAETGEEDRTAVTARAHAVVEAMEQRYAKTTELRNLHGVANTDGEPIQVTIRKSRGMWGCVRGTPGSLSIDREHLGHSRSAHCAGGDGGLAVGAVSQPLTVTQGKTPPTAIDVSTAFAHSDPQTGWVPECRNHRPTTTTAALSGRHPKQLMLCSLEGWNGAHDTGTAGLSGRRSQRRLGRSMTGKHGRNRQRQHRLQNRRTSGGTGKSRPGSRG